MKLGDVRPGQETEMLPCQPTTEIKKYREIKKNTWTQDTDRTKDRTVSKFLDWSYAGKIVEKERNFSRPC